MDGQGDSQNEGSGDPTTASDPVLGAGKDSLEALDAVRNMEHSPDPGSGQPIEPPQVTTVGEALRRYALLVAAVIVIGLVAGYFFARTDPRAAAGAVVADFVVDEEIVPGAAGEPADRAAVVPSSGSRDGTLRCGVVDDAISNDDHLTSLAAGVVVLRYGPELDESGIEALRAFAREHDRFLAAPEPRLAESEVEMVSWGKRLRMPSINRELLASFHRANEGLGPSPAPCPEG